jgi:dihydroorotase (multifunctional complex type)
MPNNSPVTMSTDSIRERARIAARKAIVNVAFYSAIPENPEEMKNIVELGAKGFKIFLSMRIGGIDPDDDEELLRWLKRAAKLEIPVLIHAEDKRFLESNIKELKIMGRCDAEAFSEAHSVISETRAVRRVVELAKVSRAHIHVCHVSAAQSIRIISSAKEAGVKITCEVTPHHLLLSSQESDLLGHVALTNPPLRSIKDREALWENLEKGIVNIIASDHAPHAISEKEKASVWEVAPGFPGLETMVPLMLTQVNKGNFTISRLVQVASKRPAEIFRIEGRGSLKEGAFADFIVVDLKKEWKIDSSKFYSKAKFSPFDGQAVRGKVVKTFVNGRLVIDEGEIVGDPGDGKIILERQ